MDLLGFMGKYNPFSSKGSTGQRLLGAGLLGLAGYTLYQNVGAQSGYTDAKGKWHNDSLFDFRSAPSATNGFQPNTSAVFDNGKIVSTGTHYQDAAHEFFKTTGNLSPNQLSAYAAYKQAQNAISPWAQVGAQFGAPIVAAKMNEEAAKYTADKNEQIAKEQLEYQKQLNEEAKKEAEERKKKRKQREQQIQGQITYSIGKAGLGL